MKIVVNGWIKDYFKPQATEIELLQLLDFIACIQTKGHKIILKSGRQVAIDLSKLERYLISISAYSNLIAFRQIKHIFYNSKTTEILTDEKVEVSSVLSELLDNSSYSKDIFLFESALQSNADYIVTTDLKLIEHIGNECQPTILISLEEFLTTVCTTIPSNK